jgi:uncharacterized iron-regulated protein
MVNRCIEQLRATRLDFMNQMKRALVCRTKKQKIKLANEWKEKYSEQMYRELISCARDRTICANIANWEDDGRI